MIIDQCKITIHLQEYLSSQNRPKHTLITKVIEGSETLPFRTNFDSWPLDGETPASENGKRQISGDFQPI